MPVSGMESFMGWLKQEPISQPPAQGAFRQSRLSARTSVMTRRLVAWNEGDDSSWRGVAGRPICPEGWVSPPTHSDSCCAPWAGRFPQPSSPPHLRGSGASKFPAWICQLPLDHSFLFPSIPPEAGWAQEAASPALGREQAQAVLADPRDLTKNGDSQFTPSLSKRLTYTQSQGVWEMPGSQAKSKVDTDCCFPRELSPGAVSVGLWDQAVLGVGSKFPQPVPRVSEGEGWGAVEGD